MNSKSSVTSRLRRVLLSGLFLTVAFTVNPSGTPTAPTLVATTTIVKPGEEVVGTGIAYGDGGVYFSAYWHPAVDEADALVGKFAAPLSDNARPIWTKSWPGRVGFDTFMGVDVATDGVYYAGASFALTSDANGAKDRKEVAVKYNLDGAPGPSAGGAVWIASQRFRPFPLLDGEEMFNGGRVSVEGGTTYFYGVGHAQELGCNSNYAIRKYTANGAIFWHWSQNTLTCGRSDFNAVVVSGTNVYAAGFSSYAGNHPQILQFNAASGSGGPSATFTGPLDNFTNGAYTSMAVFRGNIYAAGYLSSGENESYLLDEWSTAGTLLSHKVWSSDATKSNGQQLMGITAVGSRLFAVGFTRGTDSPDTVHNMGATSITLFPNSPTHHGYADGIIFELNPNDLSVISTTSYGTNDGNDQAFTGVTTDGTDLYVTGAQRSGGVYQAIVQQYSLNVFDTTPPTTTARPSLPENALGWRNVDFNVTISAVDNAGGSGVDTTSVTITRPDGTLVRATLAAGERLVANVGEGVTTAVFRSIDNAGNIEPEQRIVYKVDKTAPSLSAPTSVFAEATGSSGAIVDFTTSASDDLSGIYSTILSQDSGTTFPRGNTVVNFQATDQAGNSASVDFTVTVRDTGAPLLTIPIDFTREATGASGAQVTFSASAVDAVDGSRAVTCSPASGSVFPIATTTVNCSASDTLGNTRDGSFVVTVRDTTPPALFLPSNIRVRAPAHTATFVVSYTASSSDAVDGIQPAVCAPASGSAFPIGTTTVECHATDAHGNTSGGTFAVGVARLESISTTTVSAENQATIVAGGTEQFVATGLFSDGSCASTGALCGGGWRPAWSVAPASVASIDENGLATGLAPGIATIVAELDGASCLTSHTCATLVVRDVTPPVIGELHDVVAEAASASGAIATFSLSATDNVDPSPAVAADIPSGSTFPLGSTVVTVTATDGSGNSSSATFKVTVRDTRAPAIDSHAGIVKEATGPNGALVSYAAPATHDAVDGNGTALCAPASGSIFALGHTPVGCTARDAAGNTSASTTFDVFVTDTTPPVITTSGDVTAESTSPTGGAATFTAQAIDLVDGPITAVCTPASGSTFLLGVTTVSCMALDAHHNAASATLVVTILTTEQIISRMIAEVGTMDFGKASHLLQNVLSSISRENQGAACNQLSAFTNQVDAQRNKTLTDAEATALINSATDARRALACP